MKRALILILLIAGCNLKTFSQITDERVEQLMTRRIIDCDDITYNAVTLIPRLYKEHKTDTLNAVVGYWRRNCGMSEPVISFSILYSIEQGTFKEEIKKNKAEYALDSSAIPNTDYYASNILSYLHWYAIGCDIRNHPKAYAPNNDADYIVAAFGDYYDFLKALAEKLSKRTDLTPAEQFLVHYYVHPDTLALRQLNDPVYNGTVLKRAYLKTLSDHQKAFGINIAATAGIWIPQGNLSLLGNHPYIGFIMGGRVNKFTYDFDFTVRFINAPNNFMVTNDNDTLYKTNNYTGFYIGADLGYQVLKIRKQEIDVLGGVGWDAVNVVFENKTITNTYPSLNLNVGLGYKIWIGHIESENAYANSYLSLVAKYNFVNYNNKGGTDLTGNAFNIGIIYGFYRGKNEYNYSPE